MTSIIASGVPSYLFPASFERSFARTISGFTIQREESLFYSLAAYQLYIALIAQFPAFSAC
jgi:hypothetical protein